jgi:O-antigen ligase
MWVFLFFEPHWLVSSSVGLRGVITRIPLMLLLPTLLLLLQRGRLETIHWPFALFLLLHLASWPLAMNRGLALGGFKKLLVFFIPFSATVSVITTPARVLALFKLFILSFLWYCAQGLPFGRVRWHTVLANQDAYGPLGVMALGLGYYFGSGSRPKLWRRLGYTIAALGLVAVISSMARGAFLGAIVVLSLLWIRSPHKIAALSYGVLGLIVSAIAAEIFFPGGAFWAEMATIFEEGADTGTGRDRMVLWKDVGWRVFKEAPIFGVGAFNVGVVASEIIPPGALEGRYANPGTLYNRTLHNDFITILAEQGIAGFGVWLSMLISFFLCLRRLRRPAAREAWSRAIDDRVDLTISSTTTGSTA